VTDKFTAIGFADYFIVPRKHSNTFLDKIDQFINWKNIEKLLKGKYKKTMSADGMPHVSFPSHVQVFATPERLRIKRSWIRKSPQ
jgi:hypothetical protein